MLTIGRSKRLGRSLSGKINACFSFHCLQFDPSLLTLTIDRFRKVDEHSPIAIVVQSRFTSQAQTSTNPLQSLILFSLLTDDILINLRNRTKKGVRHKMLYRNSAENV